MKARADLPALAVSLAPVAPPCFSARDQWLEYVATAAIAHRKDHLPGPLLMEPGRPVRFNPAFAYCADCSETHAFYMHAAGKCQPSYLLALLAQPATATPTTEPAHD